MKNRKASRGGVPEEHAQANPFDALLRALLNKEAPSRNDCGYPGRFEFEDSARLSGWKEEGAGLCDYPERCPVYEECPFMRKEVNGE